jgi:alkylation response protein AidB-like acyl-CoA dehydrogenase
VDARPTPEQRELADAVDRLAHKLGPTTVGDLDDIKRRERLDAALVQAGWRELRTGTASAPLASGVEAAIVTRALARRACDTAFIGPLLAHDLLRRAGSAGDDITRAIVMADGLQSLLVGGPNAHLTTSGLAVDVSGSATAVLLVDDGGAGDLAIGIAPVGAPIEGVDLSRPVTPLVAGAEISSVDGSSRLSPDDITGWTALAVTLTAADLVGAMEGAVALATEYARERRQYGAAIGSYQAVQHMLADAKTLSEGAASAMIHAAWAVDALAPDAARAAAAVAKAYAARAARTVCETAIQVHGGIGNTWECMAHVFLRRTLLATELFGGDGPQLALLAQQRWGSTNGL